jgi:hypothetical protein
LGKRSVTAKLTFELLASIPSDCQESQGVQRMQTVEEAFRSASELYWIAFLLTGQEELSLHVTVNALCPENGLVGISSALFPPTLRMAVIQNALAATQAEITASARRFAAQQSDQSFIPARGWSVDSSMSKAQIEGALLAIDVFPRCTLLLTVFEGLSLEEAGMLLHSDRESIEAGRIRGLRELTRNLRYLYRSATPVIQETGRGPTEISRLKHQDLRL